MPKAKKPLTPKQKRYFGAIRREVFKATPPGLEEMADRLRFKDGDLLEEDPFF